MLIERNSDMKSTPLIQAAGLELSQAINDDKEEEAPYQYKVTKSFNIWDVKHKHLKD